jgi:hypothetical protein
MGVFVSAVTECIDNIKDTAQEEDSVLFLSVISKFFYKLRDSLRLLDFDLSEEIRESISAHVFNNLNVQVGWDILTPSILKIYYNDILNAQVGWGLLTPSILKAYHEKRRIKAAEKIKKNIPGLFIDIILQSTDENLELLFKEIVHVKSKQLKQAVVDAKEFKKVDEKKCVVISSVFSSTWAPTFSALGDAGWVCAAVMGGYTQSGYGSLEKKDVPTKYQYCHDLFSALVFIAKSDSYPILLNAESYYSASFDALRAATCYIFISVMSNSIFALHPEGRNDLCYLMYDGLKPVFQNQQGIKNQLSEAYSRYMKVPEKIIYQSNTKAFGDFVENTYAVVAKRLHFPRYSIEGKNPKPRMTFGASNDEYHMACITSCLDGSLDACRSGSQNAVRMILDQRVHFHYYNADSKEILEGFIGSLSLESRPFFHSHPVIMDQEELVNELHQYHIGFNPADYLDMFSFIVALEDDRKYQDGMRQYLQSTVATSYLTYAAAGLPTLTLLEPKKLFLETILFLTKSELENIKAYLKKLDLIDLCRKADEIKLKAYAENHIHELIDFIES